MTKKIIIIGCGNIGSRHLQALLISKLDLEIHVVEPNESSIKIAQERIDEIKYDSSSKNIIWHNRLENGADLAIIATTAVDRVKIIEEVVKKGIKLMIVEKMVCQSTKEYEKILEIVKKNNVKIWVNIARRYFPIYNELTKLFQNDGPINVSVTAGNNGLGTLAIHYIDLFKWLTNYTKIQINGDFLYDEIFPNKRGRNLKEFAGTIIASDGKSILTISFLPTNNIPFTVNILNQNYNILIDETNEKIHTIKGVFSENIQYKYIHVSEMTNNIIEEVFEKTTCKLPKIEELFEEHKQLFNIFNNHLLKFGEKVSLCPIT